MDMRWEAAADWGKPVDEGFIMFEDSWTVLPLTALGDTNCYGLELVAKPCVTVPCMFPVPCEVTVCLLTSPKAAALSENPGPPGVPLFAV